MKVSARSAGGQVCILHLARFNDFPGAKIVAIEPVQKTKPREKMVYFSLTAKFEWLTLVRPAATARAHSRSRNAFGEETLTSCLTRVGGPEIRLGSTSIFFVAYSGLLWYKKCKGVSYNGDCHEFCVHGIIGARYTGTPYEHNYQETNLS